MINLNYPAYNAHTPLTNPPLLDAEHVQECLIDETGTTELFGGPYQLLRSGCRPGYVSYIPSTLPNTSGSWLGCLGSKHDRIFTHRSDTDAQIMECNTKKKRGALRNSKK
jgi:hypothetical protein